MKHASCNPPPRASPWRYAEGSLVSLPLCRGTTSFSALIPSPLRYAEKAQLSHLPAAMQRSHSPISLPLCRGATALPSYAEERQLSRLSLRQSPPLEALPTCGT
mmetsp:Transcript_6798/g.16641  ORF Transcript_6798/g.16641 Transcript_6798/m.16641 type:complete len:104 (+) Transcript_6798:152-463(+)